jgi:hypothetical protein
MAAVFCAFFKLLAIFKRMRDMGTLVSVRVPPMVVGAFLAFVYAGL